MTKTYFSYKPPKKETGIFAEGCHKVLFLGNEKQIRETLKWYQIRRGKATIPNHRELIKLDKIDIICHSLPYITEDTNYLTTIYRNPFRFIIFPNMFKTIEINASSRWKRGELYKFFTGNSASGVFFLPPTITKRISHYDWNSKIKGLSKILEEREQRIQEAKALGMRLLNQKL